MSILGYELIGETATLVKAKNKLQVGMTGIVVDETKHTILLEVDGKKKRVIKKDITLHIGKYIIDGKLLVGRSEERIKVNK